MVLNKKELMAVSGGAGLSAAMLGALIRGINLVYQFGTYIGSAVSRIISGNRC